MVVFDRWCINTFFKTLLGRELDQRDVMFFWQALRNFNEYYVNAVKCYKLYALLTKGRSPKKIE